MSVKTDSSKPSYSKKRRKPSYRLHKARDCAVVTIDGKNHYLGGFSSPESHEKYARLIREWEASGNLLLAPSSNPEHIPPHDSGADP